MTNTLEKSIFFAGGKIILPESNDNNKGLRFEKSDDGSWRIMLDLKISKDEAAGIINQFTDFIEVHTPEEFEKKYPNQVYFEAFDDKKTSIDIQVRNVKLYVLNTHKNQDSGSIVITMMPPTGVGKTQNPATKTQNANT